MSERICVVCGGKISSINRSPKCRRCREEADRIKQQETRQKRVERKKAEGMVVLHSCLPNGLLDPITDECSCRKWISISLAKHYIEIGRCVDLATRDACFRGGPVVEKSRLKCPPMSSVGQRIAIERKSVTVLEEKALSQLRATADEDRILRATERDLKIDLENEITRIERSNLIREYSAEEFDAIKHVQETLPGFAGCSRDERSSIGRTVHQREEIEEIEDATTDDAEAKDAVETESEATDHAENGDLAQMEDGEFEEAA